jgi:arginine deiminase
MTMATETARYGVHSAAGELRTVVAYRPELAHPRLTPANCHDLRFGDVCGFTEASV